MAAQKKLLTKGKIVTQLAGKFDIPKNIKELGLNREIVNVNGNGIALSHPIGATGCRLVVRLIHEIAKKDLTLGLAPLCVGGGLGFAMVIERAD